MRGLSIVVTCTGRKSLPPEPGLSVRDLPAESLARRSDIWRDRVHTSRAPRRPLRELYRGEAWQRSLELTHHARTAGFVPTTYVASAGIGLRVLEHDAPAYAATFAAGHADSVAADDFDRGAWWESLGGLPGALTLSKLPTAPTLVVLSAAYASPLAPGLSVLAEQGADVLVVGGGRAIRGTKQLPANRGLRAALGGSAMSLNQRMAAAWLQRLDGRALTDSRLFAEWTAWEREAQRAESWSRQQLTDDQVMRLIDTMRSGDERLSPSKALRILRESGFACEQKRFTRLFASVMEGPDGN